MAFRRNVGAVPPSAPRAFVVGSGMIPFWDMSLKPSNNADLLDRLGIGSKVRGCSIIDVDEESGDQTIADGITNKERRKLSVGPIDPDAFVLRMWGTPKKRYTTWMPRLTADATEAQYDPAHRSTMVTDNATNMSFGWFSDLARLVTAPSGGDLIGEELAYDPAGFLETLYEKDYAQASMKRSALAYTLHRNLGFLDDGNLLGQLSHVLYLVSQGATSGSAAARSDGRARSSGEAVLRGDSGIHFKGYGVGRWKMEGRVKAEKGPNSDENRLVAPMLDGLGDADDETDTASDGNSDFQKIPKEANKSIIKWWVKVPKPSGGGYYCHHEDDSYHGPPPENGDGSGGGGSPPPYTPYGGYGDTGDEPTQSQGSSQNQEEEGSTQIPEKNSDGSITLPDGTRIGGENEIGQEASADDRTMGSAQVQHGYAPAGSPTFSQRFNVHEYKSDAQTVGTMKITKPIGHSQVWFAADLRISEAIPVGHEIELEVLIMPANNREAPAVGYSQSWRLTSATSPDEWKVYGMGFGGFDTDQEIPMLVLFIRRNELADPAPTVELWRGVVKPTFGKGV